jgi:hypothetical protein
MAQADRCSECVDLAKRTAERRAILQGRRGVLVDYLGMKLMEEDWHGIQDAASDLRDIDSELLGLER